MTGPTLITHNITLVSCPLRPFLQHFVRRGMFPTKWYRRHEHDLCSLSRLEEYNTDKLPVVGSPGGFRSTTFSRLPISLFIDNFCALQNGPPKGSL